METLLPSEIARLVLGYLEAEKCMEVAKMFLETSIHLQECRAVMSNGKRFSTRVNGMALVDIIEKYFAIIGIVREHVNKITDCEQLKHCGDVLEQLRFLIEETRGQRFVVNINVPSQNNSQSSNGSPMVPGNVRKRHHSNSDRERCKRPKVASSASQQQMLSSSDVAAFDSLEVTPLKSLPGYVDAFDRSRSASDSKKTTSNNSSQQDDVPDAGNVAENVRTESSVKDPGDPVKCTTATNTEELLNYSCAEVQTSPYDTPESGSETNDEPIENLSLLTKELLNRTELQERIAENINKAILPTDASLKEDTLVNGEANTSVMIELNNAIKSIVEETESDPVFEKFLNEIIGPHIKTDDDGDGEGKPKSPVESNERQSEIISDNNSSERELAVLDGKQSFERETTPLKHRLRSSSKQQNVRSEDEQRDREGDCTTLEDINAAAILSIINANSINSKISNEKKVEDCTKETVSVDIHSSLNEIEKRLPTLQDPLQNKDEQPKKVAIDVGRKEDANVFKKVENTDPGPKVRKPYTRRAPPTKSVQQIEEITVPTLILAPRSVVLPMNSFAPISSSRLVPIAPKDPNMPDRSLMEKMYLTTVNVAQKVTPFVNSYPAVTSDNLISCMITMASATTTKAMTTTTVQMCQENKDKADCAQDITASIRTENLIGSSVMSSTALNKSINGEMITLYGNESNAKTLLEDTSVPIINIEDNISISGSGLSPYLKFNCNKSNQNQSLSDIDLTPAVRDAEVAAPVMNNEVVKDQRLSLSTPRRKNTHIRALDFNTPMKASDETINEIGIAHSSSKISPTAQVRSACASLFKSPPFSNVTVSMHKLPCSLPVAAKSATVKLTGDCEKQNGLDITMCDTPTGSNNNATTENKDAKLKSRESSTKLSKSTWDADLRMALKATDSNIVQQKKTSGKSTKIDSAKSTKLNTVGTVKKNKNNACRSKAKDLVSKEGSSTVRSASPEKKLAENNVPDARKNDNTQVSKKDIIEEKDANDKLPVAKKVTDDLPHEKKPIKKYAQIKTLKTNLNKKDSKLQVDNKSCGKNEVFMGCPESIKTLTSSDIDQQLLQLTNLSELDTPRKLDNPIDLPPTPRLLSPASNIIIPFTKSNDDSSKVRGFINTPEFPTTPGINLTLTPKISDEIIVDDVKNQAFHSCSPYYNPTSEKAESFEKSSKLNSNNDTIQPTACAYGACVPTKLEITQFEVIKENLPKEEAIKELKIAANSSRESMQHHTEQEANFVHDGEQDTNANKHVIKENENSEDSNDNAHVSNGSSSSCSSSCSSSSDSSTSSTSTSSSQLSPLKFPPLATSKATNLERCSFDKCKKSWNQVYAETNDDFSVTRITKVISEKAKSLESETVPDASSKKHESSPLKTFPITKNEKDLKCHTKETPVKDETLSNEIDISVTPNSSKSGVDNVTNLASKISALITSENEKLPHVAKGSHTENSELKNVKGTVKIRSIDRVMSAPLIISKPVKTLTSSSSSKSKHKPVTIDEKLVIRLEAKRQRVITKFREVSKTNLTKKKTQTRRMLTKAKNGINYKKPAELKSVLRNASKLNSKKETKIEETNSSNNNDKNENVCVTGDATANSNINNNAVNTSNMNKDNRIVLKKEEEHNYYRREEDSPKLKDGVDANDRTNLLESKSKTAKRNVLIKEEKRRTSNDTELLATEHTDNIIPDKIERQTDSENGKDLSHVLQCLQLVPTSKNDNSKESQSVKSDQKLDLNKVEYHFVHDDKVSFKKRRRRYNSDELKVEVHFADSNDGIKVLSANDYEEIFDLQPVLKKRNCETSHKMFVDSPSVTRNVHPKPLATSSPLEKPTAITCKLKKITFPNGKKDKEKEKDVTQRDVKKRDKTRKVDADKAPKVTKIPKRKVSQAKESKQMEKQLCTADPQALLSNLDLDKFLNSVHGST